MPSVGPLVQLLCGIPPAFDPAKDFAEPLMSLADDRPCLLNDFRMWKTQQTIPSRFALPPSPEWIQVGPALDAVDVIPVALAKLSTHLLAGGKGGLAQFFPHSQQWIVAPPPQPIAFEALPTVRDIQVHQERALVLWSANYAENFFPYVPAQMIWHYESSAPGHVAALLVFQDVVYAGNPDGVFCRVDETEHWVSVGHLLPRGVTALAGDATSGRLFAGLSDGRVARYRDGIGEWNIFLPALETAVTALAADTDNLWIGTANGARHCWAHPLDGLSTPQCETIWTPQLFPAGSTVYRWLRADAGLFAATGEGMLRYQPMLHQWEQLAYDIDPDAVLPQACRGAAFAGAELYVTTGQAVFRYNRPLLP